VRFGEVTLRCTSAQDHQTGPGQAVLRPERIALLPFGDTGPNRVPGMVERCCSWLDDSGVRAAGAGASVQALVPNTNGVTEWRGCAGQRPLPRRPAAAAGLTRDGRRPGRG